MEELETTTVAQLLRNLKPHIGASYSCTSEVKERLSALDKSCKIKTYGEYSFRLADDNPSYYVKQILICR